MTEAAIAKIETNVGVVVVAVVTDNSSNMNNMRSLIQGNMVFTYGCQAHILKLLDGDLLKDPGREEASVKVLEILSCSTVLRGFFVVFFFNGQCYFRNFATSNPCILL